MISKFDQDFAQDTPGLSQSTLTSFFRLGNPPGKRPPLSSAGCSQAFPTPVPGLVTVPGLVAIQCPFTFTPPPPPPPAPKAGPSDKILAGKLAGRIIHNDYTPPQPLLCPPQSPSQQLYTRFTGIPLSRFKIEHGDEFFLFMDLRAERKWVAHRLTSRAWMTVTEEYNQALENKNMIVGLLTIKKTPHAMIEKMGEVEKIILNRLVSQDFTGEYRAFIVFSSSADHHSIPKLRLGRPAFGQNTVMQWISVPVSTRPR